MLFMTRLQITKVGDSAALLLTEEMMNLLGIRFGDEVDVLIENNKLIMHPPNEKEREQKLKKAIHNVFERRNSAYQKLAEGVSKA
jgi:antitoxin component of MazEF toxin-antitoxin module